MNEELTKKLENIKARAQKDEDFRQKLFSDPVTVLKEEGVEITPGLLAAESAGGELSAEQLEHVAGGGVMSWISENITGPICAAIKGPDEEVVHDTGTAGVRG